MKGVDLPVNIALRPSSNSSACILLQPVLARFKTILTSGILETGKRFTGEEFSFCFLHRLLEVNKLLKIGSKYTYSFENAIALIFILV